MLPHSRHVEAIARELRRLPSDARRLERSVELLHGRRDLSKLAKQRLTRGIFKLARKEAARHLESGNPHLAAQVYRNVGEGGKLPELYTYGARHLATTCSHSAGNCNHDLVAWLLTAARDLPAVDRAMATYISNKRS